MTKLSKGILFGHVAEFRNGLNFSKESRGSGCILIGIPEFKDRFTPDYASLPEINPIGIAKSDDYVRKNDILFVRSNGNKELVGRSLFIDKDIKALFSGFCIRARIVSDEIDPIFCAYFTRTSQFKSAISIHAGTSINNLNQGILGGVELPRYTLSSQQCIASVLSALDAKIELNNRINAELEGIAKLLYDYWFVQHDFPISAAQAAALGKPHLTGKPYRTSGGPMVFDPGVKHEIPKGWGCTTLGEVFNLYQPQTITEKDLKPEGGYFVYGANGIVGKYDRFNHEEPQIALTCRGSTCGNLTRTLPRSWITGNAMVIAPRVPNLDIEYIYNVAKASGIDAIITGSGQPQITRANLQGVKTVLPDSVTVARYQEFADPISKHRITLEQQNQELAQLRDWLLPMLMNGQVSVSNS